MNYQQEIDELNTIIKATLGVSKIEGIGVIALRNIKKGEKIYADKLPKVYSVPFSSFNKLFPEVKKEILKRWGSVINGSRFIWPDARLVSFMNHSSAYNYDPITDEILMDVKKGEEITENYKQMANWEKVFTFLK